MRKLLTILIILLSSQFSGAAFAVCIKGDCFNGYGIYTWVNGSKYIGEWKDGKMYGTGAFTDTKGNSYIGQLKDGKRHGKGIYTSSEGTIHEGAWVNNEFDYETCVSKLTWTNGDKYVGDCWYSLHGQGSLTLANGVKLVGVWKNARFVEEATQSYGPGPNISNSRSSTKKSLADTIIEGAIDVLIYKSLGVKPTWNMKLVREGQFTCTYEDKDGDEITFPRKVKSSSAKLKTDPFFGGESIKTSTTFEKCD